MKFHCSKTNTFCLAAVHVKVNFLHFLSQWSRQEHVRKSLKKDDKRAAVELWRAKVPLSTVRNQLKEGPGFQRANTLNQNKFRKPMSGRLMKISMPTRVQEVIIQEGGMTRCISTNNTVDTFDTVYSSFHWICVWPAKAFGGHCI